MLEKSKKKKLILVFSLIAVVLAFFIFQRLFNHATQPLPHQVPEVALFKAVSQDLPIFFEYSGRVMGSLEIDIVPRVDGIVTQQLYTEGQFVKKDDLLFKLDPAPYQALILKAQADLNVAKKDFDRSQQLYDKKFLSTQDYQKSQASVDDAQSDFQTAQINLSYTSVNAPIDGYTTQANISIGGLAKANTTVMTKLAQTNPIYVEFALSEDESLANRIGINSGKIVLPQDGILNAQIKLDNGTVIPEIGQVNFKDNMIDIKTASLRSRAIINNPNNILLPGQFVTVIIKGLTYKNVIAVPDNAIQQNTDGTYVYLVTADNIAKIQPVKLGLLKGSLRLIEQGLKTNDLVITEGMIKVKAGQKVHYKQNEIKLLNLSDLTAKSLNDKN